MRFTNNREEAVTLDLSKFRLYDENFNMLPLYEDEDNQNVSGDLAPGETIEGTFFFDAAEEGVYNLNYIDDLEALEGLIDWEITL